MERMTVRRIAVESHNLGVAKDDWSMGKALVARMVLLSNDSYLVRPCQSKDSEWASVDKDGL